MPYEYSPGDEFDEKEAPPIYPLWTAYGVVDPRSLKNCMVFEMLSMDYPRVSEWDIAFFILPEDELHGHELTDESLSEELLPYEAEELLSLSDESLNNVYKHKCFSAGHSAPYALDGETDGWIFDSPKAKADFSFWARMAYWHVAETIALSLGKDPRLVNEKSIEQIYMWETLPFPNEFMKHKDLINRAVEMEDLPEKIRPEEFVEWATKINLDIAVELTNPIEDPEDPNEFRTMENLSWDEITLTLLSGGHIQVSARDLTRNVGLVELGLMNMTTNKPNRRFVLLASLANSKQSAVRAKPSLKDHIYQMKKSLKSYFGIGSNPLPIQEKTYVSGFQLIDKRDAPDKRAKEKALRKTITFDENEHSHQDTPEVASPTDSNQYTYDEEDCMVGDAASRWLEKKEKK